MVKKCPKCGNRKTSEILYGLYKFKEEEVVEDKYVLGCCIEENADQNYCKKCKTSFDNNYCTFNGLTKFKFSIGSFHSGESYLYIDSENSFIVKSPCEILEKEESIEAYELKENAIYLNKPEVKDLKLKEEITFFFSREINSVLSRHMSELASILDEVYIDAWKDKYINLEICDCECWEIILEFEKAEKIEISGVGDYPIYWNKFLSKLNQFIGKEF